MSDDMQADVAVDPTGDLAREAEEAERSLNRFTTSGARAVNALTSASVGLSNGIERIDTQLANMVPVDSLTFLVEKLIDLDAKLKDVEVRADLTGERMATLKTALFDVAQAPDVRLDPRQLLAGLDAVIDKTRDADLAMGNLRNIGVAMRATGASGDEIGALVAGLAKLDITAPEEVARALEILFAQGEAGSVRMRDMAREAGAMLSAMAAIGQKGMGAVKTMGALTQTTQSATRNTAETKAAFQALIRDIEANSKALQAEGIKLFDPKASRDGKRQFLEMDKIVRQIVERFGDDGAAFDGLFSDESKAALAPLTKTFAAQGTHASLDQFQAVDGTAGTMMEDAAAKADTMEAALTYLWTTAQRVADANLSGSLRDIADAINDIKPERLNALFDLAAKGTAAAVGIWAVYKGVRGVIGAVNAVRSLGRKRSSGGSGGGGGGSTSMAAAVQPVWVTNWPPGLGRNFGMGSGGLDRAPRRRRSLARALRRRIGFGSISWPRRDRTPQPWRERGPSLRRERALVNQRLYLPRNQTTSLSTPAANGMTTTATQGSSWLRHLKKAGRFIKTPAVINTAINAASIGASVLEGDWEGAATSGGALAGGLAGAQLGAMAGSLAGPLGAALGGLVGGGVGAYLGEEGVRDLLDWMKGDDTKGQDKDRAQDRLAESLERHAAAVEGNTRAMDEGWRSHPRFSGLSPPDDTGGLMDGAP